MTFSIGDKVKHISNKEYVMVVAYIVGSKDLPESLRAIAKANNFQENDVWCEWINKAGNKKSDFFRSEMLEKVT